MVFGGVWFDDFRTRTEWNAYANEKRYEASAAPWKLVRVDPSTVELYNPVSFAWGLGQVRGGDWDLPKNCGEIDETRVSRGLRQHFEEDRDWEETVYVDHVHEQFELEVSYRGYETVEERLEAVDSLYESVREEGYRPNRGTVYDAPEDVEHIHDLEPLVLVGRSGEIIWSEGFHRLVIAALAGIEEVPVYVLRRHERWQRIRDEIATTPPDERGPELEAYADHPDVADLVD